jgi:hypothetical protein
MAWLVIAVVVAAVSWFVVGAVTSISREGCVDAFNRACAVSFEGDTDG